MTPRRTAALLGALALALAPVAPAAAAAAPGTITVTGRDGLTTVPYDEFCANLSDADFGFVDSACTTTGSVAFAGLTAGAGYRVDVSSPTSAFLFAQANGGEPVPAPADVAVDVVAAGTVDALVSAPDGSAVGEGNVEVWRVDPATGGTTFETSGFVGPDGGWFEPLPAGTYRVGYRFFDQDVYPDGATSLETSPEFTVTAGATTVLRHVVVPPDTRPATVFGRVVDRTGAPVAGACVAPRAVLVGGAPDDVCAEAGARTRADGTYRFTTLPGSYEVFVQDARLAYARSSYRVELTATQVLTVPDVALTPGGRLSGRVVDRTTGAPLADVCVSTFVARTTTQAAPLTCTGADGRWSVRGLPGGRVTVQALGDATHLPRWYYRTRFQQGAQAFTVTAGTTTRAGTIALPRGATLTGRVTDTSGVPVRDAWVHLGLGYGSRAGEGEGFPTARTDADGRYTISNAEPGSTPVTVYTLAKPYGWAFSGAPADPDDATPVALRPGVTTTLDAVLPAQARLVVDVTGIGAEDDVLLDVYTDGGAPVGRGGDAVGPGRVALSRLPGTTVALRATLPDGRVVWWRGGSSLASATPISLVAGRTNVVAWDLSGR